MSSPSSGLGENPLFKTLLAIVQGSKATDLHLIDGERPVLRLARSCLSIPETAAAPILEHFLSIWDAAKEAAGKRSSFSFDHDPFRIRIVLYTTRGRKALSFRFQPRTIPGLERLGFEPDLAHAIVDPSPGLVLIAGGPCCGKTTTLSSILSHLSANGNYHIRTFEDPIEYELKSQQSLVTQQEMGVDIDNYSDAVERGLGQDINVMAFGEIRDLPTLKAAIKAANLNMLVYGTIHAPEVASTLGRMIEEFPESDRTEAGYALKRCLKLVICQKLFIQSPVDDRTVGRALLPSILLTYQAALFKRKPGLPPLPYGAMIPDKRLRELAEHFSRGRLADGLFMHPDFNRET